MIELELVALQGVTVRQKVYEVVLPTPDGEIAIFEHHMPLVSVAAPGVIRVRQKVTDPDDFMELYATNGGLIDIADNRIRVLVDEADRADDIVAAEAEAAYVAAQTALKQARDQVSLDAAQALVDRTAVRLHVAQLRKRRKRP